MNLLIILYLLAVSPKLLFDRLRKGKRHPGFLQRIGWRIPRPTKPVIWIHAVSVGEVKAAQPLFKALREIQKEAYFLITTTSATGQAEAKRTLSEADAFAYLPIDLTWIVRRWVKILNPQHFILVESDFWYNLLAALKANGTTISLVSGKMSERSFRRFTRFSKFAKKLFSHFTHLCVQNEEYYQRFLPFTPTPPHITGNLKLDFEPQPLETPQIQLSSPAITISCTHPTEEEQLLDALLDGNWTLILAPRHPERFEEVAQLLQRKNISFSRWKEPQKTGKVLLVDTMGALPLCYSISRLAIVAGSYVEHIGGHNVLEPCLYGTPVFFGPHTFGQKEFVSLALSANAGLCVPIHHLKAAVETFFTNPSQEQTMREATQQLMKQVRGATQRTLNVLQKKTN